MKEMDERAKEKGRGAEEEEKEEAEVWAADEKLLFFLQKRNANSYAVGRRDK